jgi:hypothetical protein
MIAGAAAGCNCASGSLARITIDELGRFVSAGTAQERWHTRMMRE